MYCEHMGELGDQLEHLHVEPLNSSEVCLSYFMCISQGHLLLLVTDHGFVNELDHVWQVWMSVVLVCTCSYGTKVVRRIRT